MEPRLEGRLEPLWKKNHLGVRRFRNTTGRPLEHRWNDIFVAFLAPEAARKAPWKPPWNPVGGSVP